MRTRTEQITEMPYVPPGTDPNGPDELFDPSMLPGKPSETIYPTPMLPPRRIQFKDLTAIVSERKPKATDGSDGFYFIHVNTLEVHNSKVYGPRTYGVWGIPKGIVSLNTKEYYSELIQSLSELR